MFRKLLFRLKSKERWKGVEKQQELEFKSKWNKFLDSERQSCEGVDNSKEYEKYFKHLWNKFLTFYDNEYSCDEIVVRRGGWNGVLLKYDVEGVHGYLKVHLPDHILKKLESISTKRPTPDGKPGSMDHIK